MTEAPAALHLNADVRDLHRLDPWLEACGAASGLTEVMLRHMRIVLEEAVMNAAVHGHPDGKGQIAVRLWITTSHAEMLVTDDGRPFDPVTAIAPSRPTTILEAKPGGNGLILMRYFCPDMTYERRNGLNRLTLRFPLPPADRTVT